MNNIYWSRFVDREINQQTYSTDDRQFRAKISRHFADIVSRPQTSFGVILLLTPTQMVRSNKLLYRLIKLKINKVFKFSYISNLLFIFLNCCYLTTAVYITNYITIYYIMHITICVTPYYLYNNIAYINYKY